MKICHIITRLIVGGAQENTLLSCEGQHDRGHEVTLITGPPVGPEGSLLDRATEYGYRVEVVDELRRSVLPLKDFRSYVRLKAILRKLRPDVVHTHSSKAGIVGRWAADAVRINAVIHTIHGLSFTASKSRLVNSIYKLLEKQVAPLSTRIVCVADAMAEQSLASGIGKPGQYVTVYSGMDTAPFTDPPVERTAVRAALGIEPQHLVIGTIARLFYMKGHEDLLDIAGELCEYNPNLRFLWVGDGLLRESYERTIREQGLEDRFIFAGLVAPAKVPELVNAMDVVVHPSRREGLARALPQGSLAGKPVVGYDIDGTREAIMDGQTGIIVPPFAVEKLREALLVLIADPDSRRSMGQAGRRFALGRFGADAMVEALELVYRQALREVAV